MRAESISIKGHRCFRKQWVEFSDIRPINLVIGRNNAGKSQVLELVSALCADKLQPNQWQFQLAGTLEEADLKRVFLPTTSGGELGGNYWDEHGAHLVGKPITWTADSSLAPLQITPELDLKSRHGERSTRARELHVKQVLSSVVYPLKGRPFKHLRAERNIEAEPARTDIHLSPEGRGATNIIRRFLTSSSASFPSHLVQNDLLVALNSIFGTDAHFTNMVVKEHDEPSGEHTQGTWEIYLEESQKGQVALSKSGSGLKTVILTLLNLLIMPHIENKPKKAYVFGFEELENNLHPALLRRLLRYVEGYALREGATLFLTSHSSTALDLFGMSKAAQIIHVTHDGESAQARRVAAHFDHVSVLSELGAKPSDLLQANGIIWIEGPSDRIYVNRWLELFSDGQLREGRDYQCAFYAGALLADTQFRDPSEADEELINLLRINSNVAVICDSDMTEKAGRLKNRVERITAEVGKVPGSLVWVTKGKEIENYLPGYLIGEAHGVAGLPDPGQYEWFFPSESPTKIGGSWVERQLNRKTMDKIALAYATAPLMTKESLASRLDLQERVLALIERIRAWNA